MRDSIEGGSRTSGMSGVGKGATDDSEGDCERWRGILIEFYTHIEGLQEGRTTTAQCAATYRMTVKE